MHLLRSIRSLKVSDIFAPGGRTIATMLSLQHVTVQIPEVILTSDELEWWPNLIIESLLKYRGLRSLTLQLKHPCQGTTLQEAVWNTEWDRFQLQLRESVNDIMLQPREQTSATRRPWTFDRALKEAMAARNARHGLTPTPTLKIAPKRTITKAPLTDLKIPTTEAELLRIALTRPQAMLAWVHRMRRWIEGWIVVGVKQK